MCYKYEHEQEKNAEKHSKDKNLPLLLSKGREKDVPCELITNTLLSCEFKVRIHATYAIKKKFRWNLFGNHSGLDCFPFFFGENQLNLCLKYSKDKVAKQINSPVKNHKTCKEARCHE